MGRGLCAIGTRTWRLTDLGSKHMLLKEGIGWGYMPEHTVREDIEKGALVGSINLDRDRGTPRGATHRVTGGGRPPPVPTERSVQISRTTLFRR